MGTKTEVQAKLVQGCCGIVDPGMSEADAASVAERFKALADPTRVRILNVLMANPECCVCDVQTNFELSQGTISHHLSILRKAGLIDVESRGRWSFYRANTEAITELARVLDLGEVTR